MSRHSHITGIFSQSRWQCLSEGTGVQPTGFPHANQIFFPTSLQTDGNPPASSIDSFKFTAQPAHVLSQQVFAHWRRDPLSPWSYPVELGGVIK